MILVLITGSAIIIFGVYCMMKGYEETYYNTATLTAVGGILFTLGIVINAIAISLSPAAIQILCEENNICYELVETVAEYTDYTELEVAQFFTIVSDDVEAWDAVKMILDNPTDEQVNAIMEISGMKQAN